MSNEEQLVSPRQAADYLGVNPMTVRRFIQQGKIPAYKIGRNVRIRSSDLESFISAKKISTEE